MSKEPLSQDEQERRREFIQKVIRVYREYNLAITHEDGQGAFIISTRTDDAEGWLQAAFLED